MEQLEDYCDLILAIHRLFVEGLITKSEFERLKILSPRRLATKISDLLAIEGFCVDQITISRITKNDSKQAAQKAMQINVIIKNICGFLNHEDIKNCRLINNQWNSVVEPLLRKRGMIRFCHSEGYNRMLKEFNEVFQSSNSSLPFTSFLILGDKWRRKELSSFFMTHKKYLKELSIFDFSMKENGQTVFLFDIDLWIQGAPLTRLYLSFENDTDEEFAADPPFKVDLHKISLHLKDLTLEGCVVDVSGMNPNNRRQLTKCVLRNCTFSKNGTHLVEYRINDAVDFSQAEEVGLFVVEEDKRDWVDWDITSIIFELADNFNIKQLSVSFITIANWATSKSTVDKLWVAEIDILETTKMQIREMIYDSYTKSIDLCVLPASLEKLYLEGIDDPVHVSCTLPFNLPKLKFLSVDSNMELRVLSHFKDCNSLVEVKSAYYSSEYVTLDLSWLPKSIKKLSIGGQEKFFRAQSCWKLPIDTLVLQGCSLQDAWKVMEVIAPKILVLTWKQCFETNDSVVRFLGRQNLPFCQFYVGSLYWEGSEFLTSRLSKCVDKKAKYYRFEDEMGTAIDKSEFDKLSGED